jgi:adenosylcobyric acid synthase
MIQGTASHAGKSTLVAALCRVFARDGYRVAPFKAQNMSNNAAVTDDGAEVGRAQALQALAAGIPVTADMNPVLLKPQSDRTSQIVVMGRPWLVDDARGYYARKPELWPIVTDALDRLRAQYDIVVIEGAGSPAEINLAQYDIVNMRIALHANAPVLLVGDIDRGGVFASLYGTAALLRDEERARIQGFIINKFRGDPSLLTPGFAMLYARTGIHTLGVLPYLDLARLPAEDALEWATVRADVPRTPGVGVDVAVMRLPRIANLDEFQPLACEPGVTVRFVGDAAELGTPDLIIVPGTKSTLADLAWLRERGLDQALLARHANGTPVLGICGGFQMLGDRLIDTLGVESRGDAAGLGLLPVTTTFAQEKITRRTTAHIVNTTALWNASDISASRETPLHAYEIHMGRTVPHDHAEIGVPPFTVHSRDGEHLDGASSRDGTVIGTYLHGLFENDHFRRMVVTGLAKTHGRTLPHTDRLRSVDETLDDLASHVRQHLDMTAIRTMMDLPT